MSASFRPIKGHALLLSGGYYHSAPLYVRDSPEGVLLHAMTKQGFVQIAANNLTSVSQLSWVEIDLSGGAIKQERIGEE